MNKPQVAGASPEGAEGVQALRARRAEERVASYQCQRRGCGAVYYLTADAYHRAA